MGDDVSKPNAFTLFGALVGGPDSFGFVSYVVGFFTLELNLHYTGFRKDKIIRVSRFWTLEQTFDYSNLYEVAIEHALNLLNFKQCKQKKLRRTN